MAIALQIICLVFIAAAVVFFIMRQRRAQTKTSAPQTALAVFQVVLCGMFFALCISDVLDFRVNFSYERLAVNIFYCIAFLAIAVYTLFNRFKERAVYLKGVIWADIVLIAVQCFAFPYGTENEFLRVFESIEGAVVFGLLVALLLKLRNVSFGQRSLLAITVLELIVAVENTIVPFASITGDFQAVDIPLNYAALYMRPVIFASLALAYRAWLDRRKI